MYVFQLRYVVFYIGYTCVVAERDGLPILIFLHFYTTNRLAHFAIGNRANTNQDQFYLIQESAKTIKKKILSIKVWNVWKYVRARQRFVYRT